MLDIGIKCFLGGVCTSTEEWNFYWKIRRTSIKWICDFVYFISSMALSFIIFQNSKKQVICNWFQIWR
ncbi:hypothetical protein T01_9204 [Trichinella spiralis]|uniref:Uncharacterized protein n=1 Tax=Trichinella spiralis TaxID=6334 RepID=A0A0V1AXB5_TRISP|nr:hypothetical protein T01_9204 [Trichinella spiralis]